MQTTHTSQDALMAAIDLGGGCFFEIARQAPVESQIGGKPFRVAPKNRPMESVLQLAERMHGMHSSAPEVDNAIDSLPFACLDDVVIEDLARIAVEKMRESHLKAYYLLRATYALSKQQATFWRHTLTSCMLGFLLLRNLGRPDEAVPVLEDFETATKILTRYLGTGTRSQYLTQVAEQGLQEAYLASDQGQHEVASNPSLAQKLWHLLQGSFGERPEFPELHTRAEGFARAEILLSDCHSHGDPTILDELAQLARSQASGVDGSNQATLSPSARLPLLSVSGILEMHDRHDQALKILECISTDDGRLPLPVVTAIANRKAIALHSQGLDGDAIRILDRTPISNLEKLASGSIDAQTELLLYYLTRADIAQTQSDLSSRNQWANASKGLLRSLQQWSQIPSRNRKDDLRVLHVAILMERARPLLARTLA